ncbi:putative metal-dependent enzyme (double-stranded beta helix superfamily) [Paraburkholderia youngii]|uniref:cysteine dioxygenase family protein n=1 Tax=Paraburkholderia youngii TaxID=2782701 RepID=UPI003D1DBBDA
MSDDLRATAFEHLPDYLKSLPDPARLEAAALSTHTLRDMKRTPLERLCDTLDAMFEACAKFPEPSHSTFFARSMRLALAEAATDPALLAPIQREGSADTYRRHLLVADPQGRYAIAALVWQPGQTSPVHAHHTWCGYAVVEGKLSETVFEWDDAQQCASALRIQTRKRGAVSYVRGGRAAIHRLGNSSDAPAVSLHIYGVEGARIGTHVNDIVRTADAAEMA